MTRSKIVYGNSLEEIWLATASRKKTSHNILALQKYRETGLFPLWIEDCENKWINFEHHGKKTKCCCGFEIDHIVPQAKGGSNDISNLQALNWEDNRKKSDNLDFLDPQVHEYYKKINKKVNYDDNMPSFRHIHVGSVFFVLVNSRATHSSIGTIVSITSKYVEVEFNNNKPVKVYLDSRLFQKVEKRRRRMKRKMYCGN